MNNRCTTKNRNLSVNQYVIKSGISQDSQGSRQPFHPSWDSSEYGVAERGLKHEDHLTGPSFKYLPQIQFIS